MASTSIVTLLRSTQSTVRMTQCIYTPIIRLKPTGNYVYHQFSIQQFYVLPTQTAFMCFVWISEQTAIVSLYSINWLVCITETECVYCAVRTEYI